MADLNRLATRIVEQATDEEREPEGERAKAGRLGGQKGGKARAERLSSERRSEIARKAAQARWRSS
jgi:hypothetical protein